jgi:hypothetical protein
MKCLSCKGKCIKKGRTKLNIQKYQCLICKKYQLEEYHRLGCKGDIADRVQELIKESCGIRSISRILNPEYALEILLHLETASISSVSSILFLEMIITIPSS